MRNRCYNPKYKVFHRYGGRGIKVLWGTFNEFKNDMYGSYVNHKKSNVGSTTLDRVDNDGDYCKGNCQWSTMKEQNRNKCSNKILSFKKEKLCFNDMARRYGLARETLRERLRLGWTLKRALLTKSFKLVSIFRQCLRCKIKFKIKKNNQKFCSTLCYIRNYFGIKKNNERRPYKTVVI